MSLYIVQNVNGGRAFRQRLIVVLVPSSLLLRKKRKICFLLFYVNLDAVMNTLVNGKGQGCSVSPTSRKSWSVSRIRRILQWVIRRDGTSTAFAEYKSSPSTESLESSPSTSTAAVLEYILEYRDPGPPTTHPEMYGVCFSPHSN